MRRYFVFWIDVSEDGAAPGVYSVVNNGDIVHFPTINQAEAAIERELQADRSGVAIIMRGDTADKAPLYLLQKAVNVSDLTEQQRRDVADLQTFEGEKPPTGGTTSATASKPSATPTRTPPDSGAK